MIDNENGVDRKKLMGPPKKSIEEQLKELEVQKQALAQERLQFEEERKIIYDSLQKAIGSGSQNIGKNLGKAYKKLEKAAHKSANGVNNNHDKHQQEIGTPFNVQHKVHVDFNFKWSGNDLDQIFDFQEELGTGSYGSVHKAVHKESSMTLAIKVIPVTESEEIEKEIMILKSCNSPNIVSYFGSCHQGESLWILMDYCSFGSIRDMLDVTEKKLNEKQISTITQQALKGLHYLHHQQIIHRDIKAANILLNEDAVVKLADFGVSAQLDDVFSKTTTDFIGTPLWMPPEIIQKKPYNNKCDIWSLGITLIEMAEGYPPYYNMPPTRAMLMIPNKPPPTLSKPTHFSKELNEFIGLCCQKDPDKRPSALELLMHPFIQNASSTDVLKPMMDECSKKKASKKKKSIININQQQQQKDLAVSGNRGINKPLPATPALNESKKLSNGSSHSDDQQDEQLNTFVYKSNGKTSSSDSDDYAGNMGTMVVVKDTTDDSTESNIPAFIAALKKSINKDSNINKTNSSNNTNNNSQKDNNNVNNSSNQNQQINDTLNQLSLNIKELNEKQDQFKEEFNTFKNEISTIINDKFNLLLTAIQNQAIPPPQPTYSIAKKIFPPPPPLPQQKNQANQNSNNSSSSSNNRRSRELDGLITTFNNLGPKGGNSRPPSQQQKRNSTNLSNRPSSPKPPNGNNRPLSPKPNNNTTTIPLVEQQQPSTTNSPITTSTEPSIVNINGHPLLSPQARAKPIPPPRPLNGTPPQPSNNMSKRPPSPSRKPLSPTSTSSNNGIVTSPIRKPAPLPPNKTPTSPNIQISPPTPKSPYTPPPTQRSNLNVGSGSSGTPTSNRLSQTFSSAQLKPSPTVNSKRLSTTLSQPTISPILISSPLFGGSSLVVSGGASSSATTTTATTSSTGVKSMSSTTSTSNTNATTDKSLSGSIRKKTVNQLKSIIHLTPKK